MGFNLELKNQVPYFFFAKYPVGIDATSRRNSVIDASNMRVKEVFEKCLLIITMT